MARPVPYMVIRMEGWKIVTMALAISLLLAFVPGAQAYNNTTVTPMSGHDVQQHQQRGTWQGGPGMPGGTNPWFPGDMNVTITPTRVAR